MQPGCPIFLRQYVLLLMLDQSCILGYCCMPAADVPSTVPEKFVTPSMTMEMLVSTNITRAGAKSREGRGSITRGTVYNAILSPGRQR